MKYIKPKYIDFNISRLGLGTWQAAGGDSWSGHSAKQLLTAYRYAVDNGVNFIDTAPSYGYGLAEELVGQLISYYSRDSIFVATKCGLPWTGKKIRNDLTEQNILRECEDSLKRLKTDYIDLYQIHWPTFNGVPIEETINAMEKLKQSGKIRYIGICNHSLEDTKKWFDSGLLASYQGLYNAIQTNADNFHGTPLAYRTENEILPFVNQTGIAFFPYCPLAQGMLTDRFLSGMELNRHDVRLSNDFFRNPDLVKSRLTNLRNDNPDKSLSEIALKFLFDKKEITSVIAGCSSVEQVKKNLSVLE